MRTSTLRSAVYLSALLGIVVSLFAFAELEDVALRGICTVNSFFSCATVDRSGLTTTLGIPDYLWGVGGFVLIFALAAVAERHPSAPRWANALVLLTTAGVALSVYFLYVELVQIGAFCLVCGTAYLLGVVAWLAAIGLARRAGRPAPEDDAGAAGDDPEPA